MQKDQPWICSPRNIVWEATEMPSHQAAWHPKQVLKRSAADVANMGVDDGCVQKNPQTSRTCHPSTVGGKENFRPPLSCLKMSAAEHGPQQEMQPNTGWSSENFSKGQPSCKASLVPWFGLEYYAGKVISILSNARKPNVVLLQLLSDKRLNSQRDCKPASGLIDFKTICVF